MKKKKKPVKLWEIRNNDHKDKQNELRVRHQEEFLNI